jgi:carbonic anhydrase
MGHQSCGAVGAAIKGGDNGHNLNHLLAHISPAINISEKGFSINDVVKKNAELTVEELYNRSSIIKDAVDNGNLKIIAAYYNLDSGKVDFL